MLALPSQTPSLPDRLTLTRGDCDRSVWVFDRAGRRYCAAAAVFRALAELPGWRGPIRFLGSPALRQIADLGYYWFAAHRHYFARWGAQPACQRPGVACTPLSEGTPSG